MTAAIAAAIAANVLWGWIFTAPLLLPDFSAVEVAAGRHIAFGLFALLLGLAFQRAALAALPRALWLRAAALTLVGNVGYSVLAVWAIRLAGPAMPTLIIGVLPVTLALAGALVERNMRLAALLPGLAAISAGLLLVHGVEQRGGEGPDYALGLLVAGAAHLAWLLYGLGNAWVLKRMTVPPGLWATAMGGATLPFALILMAAGVQAETAPAASGGRDWGLFITLSAFYGVVCSWGATQLWNLGSQRLPTAVASQCIVFETLAALVFAFVLLGRTPEWAVVAGATLLFAGVVWSLRAATRT